MSRKTILITGGCGFLGQYLTKDLLHEFSSYNIKILDLKPNSNSLFDFKSAPGVNICLNKDVCLYNSIREDFENVDLVIHLAGIVSFSLKDKDLLERVNVTGTKNVLKAIKEYNVKNFFHISSVAALGYNDDKDNPINEDYKFNWSEAISKRKYYMLTKHLADVEIEKEIENGLNAVILYPGLMFGPGDITNSAKLIQAVKNQKIPFNMPGGTNIVDVRDVSKGIVKSIKKINSGHYLLSGYNLTFQEVNRTIANELSVQPPKHSLSKCLNPILFRILLIAESLSKNKLELTADNIDSSFKYRYFNNTKAKKDLGWEPEISFEKTIKDTIAWMDNNDVFER